MSAEPRLERDFVEGFVGVGEAALEIQFYMLTVIEYWKFVGLQCKCYPQEINFCLKKILKALQSQMISFIQNILSKFGTLIDY